MTATRLILIRHGEAVSGVEGIVGGIKGCRGLTARGRRQVEALRDRFARTGEARADVLLSSVLPRARETAQILLPATGRTDVVEDCELCELHPGDIDGRPWAELGDIDLVAEPDRPLSPGGESLNVFSERTTAAVRKLVADHEGQTIVVATHGGFIASSFHGLSGASGVYLETDHTSITEWLINDRWRLVRFNDSAHLNQSVTQSGI